MIDPHRGVVRRVRPQRTRRPIRKRLARRSRWARRKKTRDSHRGHGGRFSVSDRSRSVICAQSLEILSPRKAASVRRTQVQGPVDFVVLKGFLALLVGKVPRKDAKNGSG